MVDGIDAAGVHAFQAFRADPALQAAGGFGSGLVFGETQNHLAEAGHALFHWEQRGLEARLQAYVSALYPLGQLLAGILEDRRPGGLGLFQRLAL